VLELAGEYDISSDDLRAALDGQLPGPPGLLVIDLTRVTFMDAGCTGMLLSAASKRQIVLVGATGIVARVLDLLDPDQHLPRYRTRPGQAASNID
jgi:anti-anti-sigma regulatory factor